MMLTPFNRPASDSPCPVPATPLFNPHRTRISQSETRASLSPHTRPRSAALGVTAGAHILQLAVSGVKAPGYYACMVEKALKSMDLAELIKASSTREPSSPAPPRPAGAVPCAPDTILEILTPCSVLLTTPRRS